MRNFIMGVALMAFCGGLLNLSAADLVLKNGKVYKSYRVKSVKNDKVVVAFLGQDGAPDVAEINVADLPDDTVKALGVNQQAAQAVSPAEKITSQVSARLKTDLAALSAGDSAGRQALLDQAAAVLKKELAPYYSDAEFETVWNSADGVIAKVVKVNSSTVLQLNEKIFIRSASQLSSRFRALVYATGCVMPFGNNEILPVFAFDEASAAEFALKNILTVIGETAPVAAAQDTTAAAAAPAAQVYPQYQPMEPVQPVVNNYYIYENDDDDDNKKVIVERRRRSYPVFVGGGVPVRPAPVPPANRPGVRPEPNPGNRPGMQPERPGTRPHERPNVRPSNRPGRPGSGTSRPSPKDRLSKSKDKSVVQRNKNAIHSYDHLPSWAQPRYSR